MILPVSHCFERCISVINSVSRSGNVNFEPNFELERAPAISTPLLARAKTQAHFPDETINESLLMNKIVGRVADRSACNRKENRIKRALNGAIIRGNGEGARRNAQSGLRGVVMAVPPRNMRMCRDSFGWSDEEEEEVGSGGDGRERTAWEPGITTVAEFLSGSLPLSALQTVRASARARSVFALDETRRDESARVKTPACRGFVTRFDPLTRFAYANATGTV